MGSWRKGLIVVEDMAGGKVGEVEVGWEASQDQEVGQNRAGKGNKSVLKILTKLL